jgi:uncharacterized cupredoxin-like copper-binding protein
MKGLARAGAALVCAAALMPACTSAPRTVTIDMRFSHYSPAAIKVHPGETVRFRLVNGDPITHEFIIGTLAQHEAHERARDENHDGKPGQATLAPGETQLISYTFGSAGSLIFACHRPGHYAYGMRGTVQIS